MSLVPTEYSDYTLPGSAVADSYCEGLGSTTMHVGWHRTPDGERFLIEQIRTVRNQMGVVIRRDEEHYTYEVAGSPPLRLEREVWACPWLPHINQGRGLIKVDEEIIDYHPWALYTGDHGADATLTRKRIRKGWAVYRRHATDAPLDAAGKAKLEARGQNSTGSAGILVDTAQTWEEMLSATRVVEDASVRQIAVWKDPMETEDTFEIDEPDKITRWTWKKIHIRPGPPTLSGPEYVKKDSWTYRLPFPILPPKLKASLHGDAIRLEATGGGASLPNGDTIRPDRYRFLRRTVSTPGRAADSDPFRFWSTPPAADPKRKLFTITGAELPDGTPADPVPTPTAYTEPGDTSAPDVEKWVVIGEVENQAPTRRDEGHAQLIDEDVVSAAVYEYVAHAVIGSEESGPSSRVRITYGGATTRTGIAVRTRITDDGNVEGDALAPDDPTILDGLYGEVLAIEVPADVTEDEAALLLEEWGAAWLSEDSTDRLVAHVTLTAPLFNIRRGRRVAIPQWAFSTEVPGLVLDQELQASEWIVDGVSVGFARSPDGRLEVTGTTLELVEPRR